jgi:hypothetical protein
MSVVSLKCNGMSLKQTYAAAVHLKIIQVKCFHITMSCVYVFV